MDKDVFIKTVSANYIDKMINLPIRVFFNFRGDTLVVSSTCDKAQRMYAFVFVTLKKNGGKSFPLFQSFAFKNIII